MKIYSSLFKLLSTMLLLLQLSGCTGFSTLSDQSAAPLDYSQLEQLTATDRPEAVQKLILQGRTAWQQGNPNSGLLALDRALRITPDDALIYYYLANIRKERGDIEQSVALARRGLSLAYNPVLRRHLKTLLVVRSVTPS